MNTWNTPAANGQPTIRRRMHTSKDRAAMFRPVRRRSLVDQITDHLRRRIVSGELGFGRPLPPIRKLAGLYGVSLATMQTSVHALAALGLVRISHGIGTYVTRPASHAAVLDHAWRGATTAELALIRAAIDELLPPMVARRLRRHPGRRPLPAAVSEIKFLAMERSANRQEASAETFVRADLAFHLTIAACLPDFEATASVVDQVARLLEPQLRAAAATHAADARLDAAHHLLADAILDGNTLSAARLGRAIARRERRALAVR